MTPRPELTNKPANKAPKDKEFFKYSSVTKTLEAQFGMSPMMDVNKGARYLFVVIKPMNLSSPMKPINVPKAKLITNT